MKALSICISPSLSTAQSKLQWRENTCDAFKTSTLSPWMGGRFLYLYGTSNQSQTVLQWFYRHLEYMNTLFGHLNTLSSFPRCLCALGTFYVLVPTRAKSCYLYYQQKPFVFTERETQLLFNRTMLWKVCGHFHLIFIFFKSFLIFF